MPPYGQSIKQDFLMLRDNPVGDAALEFDSFTQDCCLTMPVFAEVALTSLFYNDKSGPLFFWGNGIKNADLWLQKLVNGAWTDVANLNVSTWGTAYTYAFFTDKYGRKAIGYLLDWRAVLLDGTLGEGNYRFRSKGELLIGSAIFVNQYSFEYCLYAYTPERADETVRIEWWTNGTIGHPDDDRLKRDYGTLNWYNQIRLPESRFGYDTSTYEREFVKYQSGAQTWLTDKQIEEYTLKTGRFDNFLHRFIKIDILQADEIRITDYNIDNPTKNQNKFVIVNSNYEPQWETGTLLAPVEVKFQQAFQNLNHKRN